MRAVHPRGRGEQQILKERFWRLRGSSPRARGTVKGSLKRDLVIRFIPAGAGNRLRLARVLALLPVHPRGRGEQLLLAVSTLPSSGSSPRARGTVRYLLARAGKVRFIPAGAGNSSMAFRAAMPHSVHPRGRGEQPHSFAASSGSSGSSPRARGTGCVEYPRTCRRRFIPAGAGNRLRHCA